MIAKATEAWKNCKVDFLRYPLKQRYLSKLLQEIKILQMFLTNTILNIFNSVLIIF